MKLITIDDIRNLIKKIGIQDFLLDCVTALKQDFSEWESFKKQSRQVTHYPHGVLELMPISSHDFYAVKYVNGHPFNPKSNKSTVAAIGLFAEVQYGYPLMISEMTLLTAFRTAVTSILAAEYLASKSHQTMALIGAGAQAEFQALAFHFALGVKTIRYYDIDVQAMEKFAKNLANYSINLVACDTIEAVIEGADIVTTATADKKKAIILLEKMLRPGMHINAIGGDCANKTELEATILEQCKVVVEYLPQTIEEGEMQHASPKIIYAELWELVAGKKKGRASATEITLFDSVGFALEDYSILRYVLAKANELNIGQNVNLLPENVNPKDLFGLLG